MSVVFISFQLSISHVFIAVSEHVQKFIPLPIYPSSKFLSYKFYLGSEN